MTKKAKQEIVVQYSDVPAIADADYQALVNKLQNEGIGYENITAKDVAIPYLSIVQNNSPQINNRHAKYVEGCVPGSIYNTVTKEVYKEISVIPVYFIKKVVEWRKRSSGTGAPVAEYMPDDPIVKTAKLNSDNRLELPNGNMLVETVYRYVLFRTSKDESEYNKAVIAMDSSDLTVSKYFQSKILSFKHEGVAVNPLQQEYTAKSIQDSNDKGTWFKWDFIERRLAPKESLKEAYDFHTAINKGQVKVDTRDETVETTDDSTAY